MTNLYIAVSDLILSNLIRTTNTFNFFYGLIDHGSPAELADSVGGMKLKIDQEFLMFFLEILRNSSYFTQNEKYTFKNNMNELFLIICKLYLKKNYNNFTVNILIVL